ncbi:hypothetical protein AB0E16_28915, partial [Streptomyces sp. NPDC047970]|uniref:hypothetical protein n=1 Tax=Streptomyces sp. NPDC047970 TaxID=3155481 RepID=UPI00343DC284
MLPSTRAAATGTLACGDDHQEGPSPGSVHTGGRARARTSREAAVLRQLTRERIFSGEWEHG